MVPQISPQLLGSKRSFAPAHQMVLLGTKRTASPHTKHRMPQFHLLSTITHGSRSAQCLAPWMGSLFPTIFHLAGRGCWSDLYLFAACRQVQRFAATCHLHLPISAHSSCSGPLMKPSLNFLGNEFEIFTRDAHFKPLDALSCTQMYTYNRASKGTGGRMVGGVMMGYGRTGGILYQNEMHLNLHPQRDCIVK